MEKLSVEKRASVIRCLVEGNSIASTVRLTGITKPSILKTLEQCGEACTVFTDEIMVDLPCETLQLDELWAFCGAKDRNKEHCKGHHLGSIWTWTSYCPDTKIIPTWRVGGRSHEMALEFLTDVADRSPNVKKVFSDGLQHYKELVPKYFPDAAYGQVVKTHSRDADGKKTLDVDRRIIRGDLEKHEISTSLVERSNLMIRMGNRRYTRKTNGHSKKIQNHNHMLAIQLTHYNACRPHMSLGKNTTPAMAAGKASRPVKVEELLEMVDAYWARQIEEAFEKEFQAKYTPIRHAHTKVYTPNPTPLVPWYLDKDSGGPNPPKHLRKAGIRYEL